MSAELRTALEQIDEIRGHLSRQATFRGYRAATAAWTGLVAFVAAAVHVAWGPDDPMHMLALWIAAAVLAAGAAATEMAVRYARSGAGSLNRQAMRAAVSQFVPCVVAGALVTVAITMAAPRAVWMLPGLWAVLFALGLLASRPMVPRGLTFVAAYDMLAGLACLVAGPESLEFWPWTMALTFGIGQLLVAGVLYWSLERPHAQT